MKDINNPSSKFTIIHVAAAILWQNDNFLATLRPEGKPMAGFWEFPGGKIEQNETPEMAIYRECYEELGIEAREAEFLFYSSHLYPDENISVCLHFFLIKKWDFEPFSREGQTLLWVTPSQALRMNFLPADLEVVKELNRRLKRCCKLQDSPRSSI